MTFKPTLFIFLGLTALGSHSFSADTKNAPPAEESPSLLFYGNSMIERLLEHGGMEARLQIATSGKELKIRSLAWTGDEVGNRLRLEGGRVILDQPDSRGNQRIRHLAITQSQPAQGPERI